MRVHIIGAGLAGLSAAVHLRACGADLCLYEAAPRAGGRCRSYHDAQLGCVIDNGNHLLMSGNASAMAYLDAIGARDRLTGPASADYPFLDVSTGARWTIRPTRGRIPWWILDAERRAPGTTPASYLSVLRLLQAAPHQTVTDIIKPGTNLYRNFWEPLTVAALNTDPAYAAAALMRPVLRETFLKGADACRPLIARSSLADALIDPALTALTAAGAELRFGCRVRSLVMENNSIATLETDDGPVTVDANDVVILAAPAWVSETLVPGLCVPPPGEPIVNVHYRLPHAATSAGEVKIIGLVGGLAQWVFLHGDIASVTISAAGALVDEDAGTIATRCWHDVALVLGRPQDEEPHARVIKEKRATFAQTPQAIARRPDAATRLANLLLAGDWTATGLPATIEGAVRSGERAADLARGLMGARRIKAA